MPTLNQRKLIAQDYAKQHGFKFSVKPGPSPKNPTFEFTKDGELAGRTWSDGTSYTLVYTSPGFTQFVQSLRPAAMQRRDSRPGYRG